MPKFILKTAVMLSALVLCASCQSSKEEKVEAVTVIVNNALAKAAEWHEFAKPSGGSPVIAGSYANGCISGAATLSHKAPGHIVMRPSRNRNYGHPALISFVDDMSRYSAGTLKNKMLIGDLSQPRGGPMNFGHASHQVGLDVDIWLQMVSPDTDLSEDHRENREFVTTVDKKLGVMKPGLWKPQYTAMIRRASEDPRVARIFVNPIIKKHLCETENEAPWLRKVRAWWGHDAHFHVRLNCPEGMTGCKPQSPPPPGSGCTKDLDRWIYDQANPKPKDPNAPEPPERVKILPDYCQRMLAG